MLDLKDAAFIGIRHLPFVNKPDHQTKHHKPMTTTATEKQVSANRQNSQKSTGPKSPEGRASSKMNALKHGIRSRHVLVHGRNLCEDEEEFTAFQDRFHDELDPVGPMEEMLVDTIVATQWRLYRVLKAESGEIALSVDEGSGRPAADDSLVNEFILWSQVPDPVGMMMKSAKGIAVLMVNLSKTREVFEKDGKLTKKAVEEALTAGKPNGYSLHLAALQTRLEKNPGKLSPRELLATHRQEVRDYLDKETERLKEKYRDADEREEIDEESRLAAKTLPPMETLERIMRYEAKLERQLYRAMAHLERVQCMRRGVPIPTPLKIEPPEKL